MKAEKADKGALLKLQLKLEEKLKGIIPCLILGTAVVLAVVRSTALHGLFYRS